MNIDLADGLARLKYKIEENKSSYSQAEPFPFVIIDNFLRDEDVVVASASFPHSDQDTWTNYIHFNEKKYGLNKREFIPPAINGIIDALQSSECLESLRELTGIPGLMTDELLTGSGLHQMYRGGFLNIHSDFLVHPLKNNLRRRINLILFLSQDWRAEFGGELEFWNNDMTQCIQRIQPLFNRCIIFNTDEYSFHGCPAPLKCPSGISRKSLALYYYTEYAAVPQKQSTRYMARPEDKHKRIAIFLDNQALALYAWLKRQLKFSDSFVSRLLKIIKLR